MSYKIKPLVWVEGWGEEEPYLSAKTIRDDQYDIWGSDEHGYSANLMDDGCELGYYPTLQEVKNACQQHHEKRIEDLLSDFIYPDNEVNKWNTVIDSKAFVVSQIGAVENLIKCAQEGGDLVAVVQLKQKIEELERELKGNGSEVMKAFAELRAALSEKDMQAINEGLKERGIGVQLVPDPAVPEGEVWVLDENKYLAECRKRAYGTMKDIGDPDVYLRDLRGDEK